MSNVEDVVKALVDSIVEVAMKEEFEDAMQGFNESISPQWRKTLATVFQSGVEIGVARALGKIAGVK